MYSWRVLFKYIYIYIIIKTIRSRILKIIFRLYAKNNNMIMITSAKYHYGKCCDELCNNGHVSAGSNRNGNFARFSELAAPYRILIW